MKRRTRRPSIWRIGLLIGLIGVMLYVNQIVVPATDPLFVPTATVTRSPESFVSQAEEAFRGGKLNQAVAAYEDAVFADPGNPSSYITLARLQVFAGKYDDAVENAQNALLKNPDNPTAYAVLGWALSHQDKYADAELAIKEALARDPNNALAHAYYAEMLVDEASDGKDYTLYERAAESSKRARDLDPSLLETHRARGIVLLNTGNTEEAVQEFQAALAINKNIPDLNMLLGVAYKTLGEYGAAQDALLVAYTLNPTDTDALTELSRSFFADGRYPQAAQYAEEAIKVRPADPRLHGNLGITYYKMEEFNKAIPSLKLAVNGGAMEDGTAVEGLPLNYGREEEYYWYLGFALAKQNRCSEAVPIFQALLTGVPNDEIAVYNATEGLAICAENMGTPRPPTATPEEGEATPSP